MKKVIAVIGSPNNQKSNTVTMTRDFLELVKEYNREVEYEIISLGDKDIQMCRGCWGCTISGKCVIKDDMEEIRQKILECDFLILGSPVYVHQISAQMKVFFDRIFVWVHTVKLIGKPALTSVTTGGSGRRPTEKYLTSMMTVLGSMVVGHLRGIGYKPGHFPNRERCKQKHRKLAKKVADILGNRKKVKPTWKNSFYFWAMKSKAKYGGEQLRFENNYWREKGWLDLSYRQAMQLENEKIPS